MSHCFTQWLTLATALFSIVLMPISPGAIVLAAIAKGYCRTFITKLSYKVCIEKTLSTLFVPPIELERAVFSSLNSRLQTAGMRRHPKLSIPVSIDLWDRICSTHVSLLYLYLLYVSNVKRIVLREFIDTAGKVSALERSANPHFFVPTLKNRLFWKPCFARLAKYSNSHIT